MCFNFNSRKIFAIKKMIMKDCGNEGYEYKNYLVVLYICYTFEYKDKKNKINKSVKSSYKSVSYE